MPPAENGCPEPSERPDEAAGREPAVGPFTDYGQFGVDHLDTRVLWQDEVWVDRTGSPHRLHEMSPEYLTNVIGYLDRRAPEWHLGLLLEAVADLTKVLAHEGGAASLERALGQLGAVLALDPQHWIDDTPLMRTLRRVRGDNPGSVTGPR